MSIVLHDLVKRFGGHAVVDNVSTEIRDGELFVLLGPSGSGKSTILRIIAGLVPADDGRVVLHGRDVTFLPPQDRNIGLVFQDYALFPHMTVAENVEFGLVIRKVPKEERVAKRDELLAMVDLAGYARRDVRQLSGGQRQRVAVARALAFEPSVLLLDEPFGALDVKVREQLRRALKGVQRRLGVTTILVTHDQEEAFELADRIGVVEDGRLLELGEPSELYRRPKHQFVAQFLGDAALIGTRRVGDRVRIGEVELPIPATPPGTGDAEWALLFRPEDLSLADPSSPDGEGKPLGIGRVEEVLDLGPVRRVGVRIDSLPHAWHIGAGFGEKGIPLRTFLPALRNGEPALRAGQEVRVEMRGYHMLPRLSLRVLGWVGDDEGLDEVFPTARALATTVGGEITFLVTARDESDGQRKQPSLASALSARGMSSPIEIQYGPPVEAILRTAVARRADLILVPNCTTDTKLTRERRFVAEELARRGITPVLFASGQGTGIERVLLCTGAGEPGKADVAFGGRFARSVGAHATLLYVDDRRVSAWEQEWIHVEPPWVREHLKEGVEALRARGVSADVEVRRGPVLDEILAEAEHRNHDVIVVGAHVPGSRGRSRATPDLASQLVRRATRSVLVVHDASVPFAAVRA
ncbi:MAG TPA: ATP-binding cassette domain-containing protein [Gemmatimonadota bacterium]|nr:ATP-binding cassette domain-containing protein [Gemmatimonadota bacterium]